jgi:hypothetical protein
MCGFQIISESSQPGQRKSVKGREQCRPYIWHEYKYQILGMNQQQLILFNTVCVTSQPSNMPSAIKNVILIGAGGRLGPSILSVFVGDPYLTVSILARHSSKSTFPPYVKVHGISDEYPEAELLEAFEGQDAVISTIATVGAVLQKSIIDAAIKAGVKRFVPSEFGSDTRNEKAMAILPQYFKGKLETVEYLKTKEKAGLTWTAFVTGPFFDL